MSSEDTANGVTAIGTEQPVKSMARAWGVAGLLMIGYTFSFLDREILYLLVTPIKEAFQLDEFQMSLLLGPAFGIFYTVMGVPLGWAADRFNRTYIIAIGMSLWSIMTAVCGLANNFIQLFVARIGVGVGEASLTPSAISLLSDTFPKEKLPFAISIYSMGVFVGSGLAMIGGAYVISLIEDITVTLPLFGTLEFWQLAFLVVALPGIVLAIIIACLKEPKRKEMELDSDGLEKKASISDAFKFLFQNKKLLLCFFFGGSLIASIGYHSAWYPELFMRTWGWTRLEAGQASGVPSIIGGTAGLILGGIFMSHLTAKGRKDSALLLSFIAALGIGLPAISMPLMPNGWAAVVVMVSAKFFVGIPLISGTMAIRMVAPNQMRGQLVAVYFIFVGLLATTLGPVMPGFFTTYVFEENVEMLRYSLSLSAAIVVPIGALLIWVGWQEYKKVVYAKED